MGHLSIWAKVSRATFVLEREPLAEIYSPWTDFYYVINWEFIEWLVQIKNIAETETWKQ